ncbi:disease resistance protein Roq1-like [Syzygium oleosum]|uniref:disease resistance protein Roq1-like n=1 Tax=Syzygium oleosum TaxID=219896 RepID=UPI0024BA767A|nr:disease resistance protein Roq1-like [Syzygium oleosum]
MGHWRETSSKPDGLVHLQKALLYEILWKENLVVFSVDGGVNLIRDRLCCRKILLVPDDVDHGDQSNALARECEWFGKGSRIIITTRDKHVLTSHWIDQVDEVKALDQGIVLDLPTQEELDISPNALTHMRRLKLLIVLNAQISGGPICLSNDLRWLEWPEYPLSTLKFSAGPKKLVWLDVHNSRIKELGGNLKHFRNLKFLNFSRCKSQISVPDFSEVPNLETLNLRRCSNLKELPSKLKLKYLRTLDVTGCSKLDKFPDIEEMESLRKLYMSQTSIKELPTSIEKLISVKVLLLNSCKCLISLPCSIYKMQSLEHLSLENCSMFGLFPENSESSNLPNGRRGFPNLVSLKLSGCNLSEAEFLQSLTGFSTLNILDLSGNNLVSLPTCISKFEELMVLKLYDWCGITYIRGYSMKDRKKDLESKRSKEQQKSALNKLAEHPNESINSVLKISFEALDDLQKEVSLNIGCFFVGKDQDNMNKVLDACGFEPSIDVQVLVESRGL